MPERVITIRSHVHNHVEYHVSPNGNGNARVFYDFPSASTHALTIATANGSAVLDVCICSEDGAREYGGDDAVDSYREDPEASVFERFEIKVNAVGRVP